MMHQPQEAGPITFLLASAFAPLYTVTFCDGNREYTTRLYSEAMAQGMTTPDGGTRVVSGNTVGFITRRILSPQEVAIRLAGPRLAES